MVRFLSHNHRCLPPGDSTPMIPQSTFIENGTDSGNCDRVCLARPPGRVYTSKPPFRLYSEQTSLKLILVADVVCPRAFSPHLHAPHPRVGHAQRTRDNVCRIPGVAGGRGARAICPRACAEAELLLEYAARSVGRARPTRIGLVHHHLQRHERTPRPRGALLRRVHSQAPIIRRRIPCPSARTHARAQRLLASCPEIRHRYHF